MQILPQALAPTTQVHYSRSWTKYLEFTHHIGISASLPISIRYACLFLVFLFNHNFAASSLSTITSGLSYFHKIRNITDPFQSFPVRQMLQALKKVSPSSPDTRRPISECLLFQLLDKIPTLGLPAYESTLFATMFLFAFYFGLRIGEITSSQHNLQYDEIKVTPSSVVITFHSHKHSNRQSLPHSIQPTSLRHCPVAYAIKYLNFRPPLPGPFFMLRNKPISSKQFSSKLRQLLILLNLPHQSYSPHSFRIGAATHWFSKDLSEQRIRQLGRWSSNAFSSYIRSFIDHSA